MQSESTGHFGAHISAMYMYQNLVFLVIITVLSLAGLNLLSWISLPYIIIIEVVTCRVAYIGQTKVAVLVLDSTSAWRYTEM